MPSSEHRSDLARRSQHSLVALSGCESGGRPVRFMIFGIGWMALGRRTWIEQPGVEGYLVMLTPGGAISVGIEWTTVHVLHWWRYDEQMPLVPLVNIGIVPVIQMLVLPPLIFRLVAIVSRYVDGMRAKAWGR